MSTHSNTVHDSSQDPSQSDSSENNGHNHDAQKNGGSSDPEEETPVSAGYKRVGRLTPSQKVRSELEHISDQFIIDAGDAPEAVGGNIDDTDKVRACLQAAIDFFHNNLSDDHRENITKKWGIKDSMIDARKIGFVDGTNDVVGHLVEQGFDRLTISRAGIATASELKHLFECSGVSTENEPLVEENRRHEEIDRSCSHSVDETIETLLRAQLQGLISPGQIDLQAVADYLDDRYDGLTLWNWWDNRITFPYRDEDGEFCYLIVRATKQSDDIIYNNGIEDRTIDKVLTVADTELGQEMSLNPDALEEFVVLPYRDELYTNPSDDGNRRDANDAIDRITAVTNEELSPDALMAVGVTHDPGLDERAEKTGTARVSLIDVNESPDGSPEPVLTPPALGVEPGTEIEFTNHTAIDAELDVLGTPDGVWWDNGALDQLDPLEVSKRGKYRFRVKAGGVERNGILVVYDDVYTDRRNPSVENWVSGEPGFDVDKAKYIKQTIDRAWINNDAIVEPIFGAEHVFDQKPLVVTEGVTDAIMAHQNNIPCVAPATTNFKQHHYDLICEHANRVSAVYVVNDNEVNDAGVNGALRTAKVIENDGHIVRVGELPRANNQDKVDVAEFLKHNDQAAFTRVLEEAIPPEKHPKYDPSRHDPTYRSESTDYDSGYTASASDSTSTRLTKEELGASNVSAIYSLELADVINFDALPIDGRSGTTIYRGENPIQHHGKSVGYFVIRENGDSITAKDYKIESNGDGYYYNAMTWLACEATCDCPPRERCGCTRSTTRPMGPLSKAEVWWVWKHAKEAEHIDVPDDDPMPLKAVWYLAEKHKIIPTDFIPDEFEEGPHGKRLTPTPYNRVLEIVQEEYGMNPGREPRELPLQSRH